MSDIYIYIYTCLTLGFSVYVVTYVNSECMHKSNRNCRQARVGGVVRYLSMLQGCKSSSKAKNQFVCNLELDSSQ